MAKTTDGISKANGAALAGLHPARNSTAPQERAEENLGMVMPGLADIDLGLLPSEGERDRSHDIQVADSGGVQGQDYPDLFKTFRKNLAPREGGLANRPKSADPGGLTQKGISQEALDLFRQSGRWPNLPAKSDQLSDQQINEIFYKEYFDRPHLDRLASVPGLSDAAPKLTEQVFDAGVLHGVTDAGRWLQESLDEALGTDLRVKDDQGNLHHDGIIGPATRRAVEQAVKTGKIKSVNNRFVDRRSAYMKTLRNSPSNPGWIPRAESFRMTE